MSAATDILVIEDEPRVAEAVVKVCGAEGMAVTDTDNALAALRLLERRAYSLVLCDIMLPDMDGFQFLEAAEARDLETPVVMMTGYSTMENAVKSLSLGAVDYIPKPFTADELLSVVHRSLRCGALLKLAESAGSTHTRDSAFVSAPADFFRLGYISWAVLEHEGTARIGINDLFLKTIDGIRGIELSEPGEELLQGTSCGLVESEDGWKHQVMCPLGGEVLTVNAEVGSNPSLVEKDPYFRGWLYRILPTQPENDLRWLNS